MINRQLSSSDYLRIFREKKMAFRMRQEEQQSQTETNTPILNCQKNFTSNHSQIIEEDPNNLPDNQQQQLGLNEINSIKSNGSKTNVKGNQEPQQNQQSQNNKRLIVQTIFTGLNKIFEGEISEQEIDEQTLNNDDINTMANHIKKNILQIFEATNPIYLEQAQMFCILNISIDIAVKRKFKTVTLAIRMKPKNNEILLNEVKTFMLQKSTSKKIYLISKKLNKQSKEIQELRQNHIQIYDSIQKQQQKLTDLIQQQLNGSLDQYQLLNKQVNSQNEQIISINNSFTQLQQIQKELQKYNEQSKVQFENFKQQMANQSPTVSPPVVIYPRQLTRVQKQNIHLSKVFEKGVFEFQCQLGSAEENWKLGILQNGYITNLANDSASYYIQIPNGEYLRGKTVFGKFLSFQLFRRDTLGIRVDLEKKLLTMIVNGQELTPVIRLGADFQSFAYILQGDGNLDQAFITENQK